MAANENPHVLIAGIGGASLGTELGKALALAGGYRVTGCDISSLAFGHYGGIFAKTFLVDQHDYIDRVLDLCIRERVHVVLPGGEQPARLIAEAADRFAAEGIAVATNEASTVTVLGDKQRCFAELMRLGFAVPKTVALTDADADATAPIPCVVKPSVDSGGSSFVFFAGDRPAVRMYAAHLRHNGLRPLAQEYISHEGGEFTIGVLSGRQRQTLGSIAMRREFPAKLSIAAKGADFLISSGISQGYIGPHPEVRKVAEAIADAVGSTGPLNVQGRVDKIGNFLPFEINPRFSATTYLRALAGFNEADYYIRHILGLTQRQPLTTKPGWYLRSLTETVVAPEGLVT